MGSQIVKLRLPPDLATEIDRFATRVQAQNGSLNTSSVLRILLRAGLAADAGRTIDLREAAFAEGYAAGYAQVVEAHQRALHESKRGAGLGMASQFRGTR